MIKFENIAENLKGLVFGVNHMEFISSFLEAFDFPQSTIQRVQLDNTSMARIVKLKKKILFIYSENAALHLELELYIEKGLNSINERYIIIYNSTHLLAYDVRTKESLKSSFEQAHQYIEFFLPLLGQEKISSDEHKSVDIKAAEKLASIYNELITHPEFKSQHSKRHLDIIVSRLLFCFWIDSLGLLGQDKLKRILSNHTLENGSNTNSVLKMLFEVLRNGSLNTAQSEFKGIPKIQIDLFSADVSVPPFSRKARKQLIDLSNIDWSNINPDILGSLIQTIVDPEDSTGLSNHYTSSSNILKAIGPLFLDDLYRKFDQNKNNLEGLKSILDNLQKIKVFDPSCGAANFLIVSLKELGILASQIHERIEEIQNSPIKVTEIDLSQFYGIDESYFKLQIAKIGLCIESLKNKNLGEITLDEIVKRYKCTNLTNANPTEIEWTQVCKSIEKGSVFIVSNPTYKGARKQTTKQKKDVSRVFSGYKNTKNLDYSSCWLYLASKYIELNDARCSIVTTNSLTQGEQVELLWPKIFAHNIEICFAHNSFKWKNSSKGNTGVTVVIIGLCKTGAVKEKKLFGNEFLIKTNVISPYLTAGISLIVKKQSNPISKLPPMPKGNMPYDGGNLILSKKEKEKLISEYPSSVKYLRKLLGSKEFIQGLERWCLWIPDEYKEEALSIPPINSRVEKVYELRSISTDSAAKKLAQRAHQFREINSTTSHSIIIPSVSSERREYIPIGFVDETVIISNLAFAIYDCYPWIFGLLTSRMHNLWIKTVCGSLETRVRYSSRLGYNTFPFPDISEDDKQKINLCVFDIIGEREKHSEKTLAQLYDPEKMPSSLLTSHRTMDKVIENCYRQNSFASDQERIDYLFNYYNQIS